MSEHSEVFSHRTIRSFSRSSAMRPKNIYSRSQLSVAAFCELVDGVLVKQ